MAQWQYHFTKYPFTVDLLDYIGAHICQAIIATMGTGKRRPKLEDFLLIRSDKKKMPATKGEFRSTFAGSGRRPI